MDLLMFHQTQGPPALRGLRFADSSTGDQRFYFITCCPGFHCSPCFILRKVIKRPAALGAVVTGMRRICTEPLGKGCSGGHLIFHCWLYFPENQGKDAGLILAGCFSGLMNVLLNDLQEPILLLSDSGKAKVVYYFFNRIFPKERKYTSCSLGKDRLRVQMKGLEGQ